MKLATCICVNPGFSCRTTADAEDLLCTACRGLCIGFGIGSGPGIHIRETDFTVQLKQQQDWSFGFSRMGAILRRKDDS